MSRFGHPEGLVDRPDGAALVGLFPIARGHDVGEHRHPTHQLAWAASGVLRVEITDGAADVSWVLTPSRALWIPAGTAHRTGATEAAAMRGIYLRPARCPVRFGEPTVLGVGPLLAALIDHLGRDDLAADARARAEAVLFDQLDDALPGGAGPVRLAWPRDPRARRVADALAADPADDRALAAWSRLAGAGERTLARLFLAETGLGPGRWRSVVRVRAALELLAAGEPVAAVAHRVGYRTPSAFVAAFRRETGCTPGRAFTGLPPRRAARERTAAGGTRRDHPPDTSVVHDAPARTGSEPVPNDPADDPSEPNERGAHEAADDEGRGRRPGPDGPDPHRYELGGARREARHAGRVDGRGVARPAPGARGRRPPGG